MRTNGGKPIMIKARPELGVGRGTLMGSLGLGEGLVVMAEASGVRTSDQG